MNSLVCFLCKRDIPLNLSYQHFWKDHDMPLHKNDKDHLITCINNNCNTNFRTYRAFKSHIKQYHLNNLVQYQNEHNNVNINNIRVTENLNNEITNLIEIDLTESLTQNNDTNNKNENLEKTLKYMIAQLRSKTSITESDFKIIIESFEFMSETILKQFNISELHITQIKKNI